MSSEDLSNAKRRRVARACDTCRRKKVRCDGVQPGSDPPSCTNCKAYGYECSFIDAPKKRGPPKGYIEALETRLQRMESILGGLVQSGDLPEGTINSNLEWINVNESNFKPSNNSPDRNNPLRKSDSHDSSGRSTSSQKTHSSSSKSLLKSHKASYGNSDTDEDLSTDSNDYGGSQYDLNDSMGQLAIDEGGHTRYLGNSSGIFVLKYTKKSNNDHVINVPCGEWHSPSKRRIDMTLELPPKELCDQLLDTFWTQVHPYMIFIDKQDFMEKYNSLEANYSYIILLYAMFAIAAKYLDDPAVRANPEVPSTAGDEYFNRAKELLKDEFDNATLTTIQALILLAGHQQGAKNSTMWLYIGLAIRLAQDMGLHRDSSKWNLDERQSEIRKRIWWACFLGDRLISAALGRPLAINDADCDVGLPVVGIIADDPAHSVEGFIQSIKIIAILGKVLSHIYGIKAKRTINGNYDSVLADLDAELNEWHENLPVELKFDSKTTSFVGAAEKRRMFIHLVYYSSQILLHRPHIRGPKSNAPPSSIPSLTICTMAANNITHIIFRSMKDGTLKYTWNFSIYSFFTASTMHIINALSGDDRFREVAKQGLRMTLKCLEFLRPYWFATEKVQNVFNDLIKTRNINLDGTNGVHDVNPVEEKKSSTKKRRSIGEDDSSNRIPNEPGAENTFVYHDSSPEIPRVTFTQSNSLPSPPPSQTGVTPSSIREYNAAMRKQHMFGNSSRNSISPLMNSPISPLMNGDQISSPESTVSSSGFTQFNDFNLNSSLFPSNADSFSSGSHPFGGDDSMCDSNPFLSLPSAIDWSELNDWTQYMVNLQPTKMNGTQNHIITQNL
ncbi:13302_t:CDS:2 [Acaulospora morrowiae]|uniref:13302_t:CDS:1 n=1 Tax=Acaulospora morrowiae TaxID=94023 RepID=A0A9N9G9Q8_9GLOM|nr:13302_t:CDS:2 [Acaulospora morrowiae]